MNGTAFSFTTERKWGVYVDPATIRIYDTTMNRNVMYCSQKVTSDVNELMFGRKLGLYYY